MFVFIMPYCVGKIPVDLAFSSMSSLPDYFFSNIWNADVGPDFFFPEKFRFLPHSWLLFFSFSRILRTFQIQYSLFINGHIVRMDGDTWLIKCRGFLKIYSQNKIAKALYSLGLSSFIKL